MIFVTVGTGEFPRLIKAADAYAEDYDGEVIIQGALKGYAAKHAEYHVYLQDISSYIEKADIIISHCGVGTIQRILAANKPAVIVPRRHKFNEHYDDHQWTMTEKMKGDLPFLFVDNIDELPTVIRSAKEYYESKSFESTRPHLIKDLKGNIAELLGYK